MLAGTIADAGASKLLLSHEIVGEIMKQLSEIVISLMFVGALTTPVTMACAQDDDKTTTPRAPVQSTIHHYFSKDTHRHDAEWSYSGKQGPAFWGTLSPKYHLATDGLKQSPIDICRGDVVESDLPALKFRYRSERLSIVNNGHTIQHNEHPGSFLQVGKQVYVLEQFHVHVPSEHTIDGKHADMEIHFVHKSLTGHIVVVAVLADAGTDEPVEIPVHIRLPQTVNAVVEPTQSRNPTDFIPTDHRYVTYSGSFTTPPCSEGVRWIVMNSPIQIASSTLARFRQTLGRNIRPVQPLHGREVAISP